MAVAFDPNSTVLNLLTAAMVGAALSIYFDPFWVTTAILCAIAVLFVSDLVSRWWLTRDRG